PPVKSSFVTTRRLAPTAGRPRPAAYAASGRRQRRLKWDGRRLRLPERCLGRRHAAVVGRKVGVDRVDQRDEDAELDPQRGREEEQAADQREVDQPVDRAPHVDLVLGVWVGGQVFEEQVHPAVPEVHRRVCGVQPGDVGAQKADLGDQGLSLSHSTSISMLMPIWEDLLTPGWTARITFLTGSFLELPEELPVLAEDGWHGAERRGEVLGQRDLGFHRRITVLGQDSPRRPGRARSTAYFRQQNPDLNGVRYRDLR